MELKDNLVIYSAIFGKYDTIHEPTCKVPYRMVLFTDMDITSNTWEVVKVPSIYEDATRSARKYKILPHRYFKDTKYSIWIDGNFNIINENISDLLKYVDGVNKFAACDHIHCYDKRDCIYDEFNIIMHFGGLNNNYKDNPILMKNQIGRYAQEGYPAHNGLISSGILVREHNDPICKSTMEMWWNELKFGSKRDQLSFNYVAWKNKMPFNYMPMDVRDNMYLKHTGEHSIKIK